MGPAPIIVVQRLTDSELIARSLVEPERFSDLFRRHHRAIATFCARRLEASVADEVAAEVFVRAYTRRAEFDLARPSALPWLYSIALDLIGRHRRSERRRLAAYARLDTGPAMPEDDEALARAAAALEAPVVARALMRLRPGDRDLVLLVAWAQLSYEQAAEALGVPVGTVRSRLNRAREALRRDLDRRRS